MKQSFTDQLGNKLVFDSLPKRIISLVPSQTELLFYLGLNKEVVGITKFCIHPTEQFKSKTKIGGTKNFHFDSIQNLNPDLIIGNKEENQKDHIEKLQNQYPLWMSDIKTLDDAYDMILELGKMVGKEEKAIELVDQLKVNFNTLDRAISKNSRPKIAYLIWNNPMMIAGNNTFINHMIDKAGFQNVFTDLDRYPSISSDQLKNSQPDYVFLSSEPFPFKEKHVQEIQEICPTAKIVLVDGELFSWYGNRLLISASYFLNLHNQL